MDFEPIPQLEQKDLEDQLRVEDWSLPILATTMKKKYEQAGLPFPNEGPFLIKIFLPNAQQSEEGLGKLRRWCELTDIPFDAFLDLGRTGREKGEIDFTRAHLDIYGADRISKLVTKDIPPPQQLQNSSKKNE